MCDVCGYEDNQRIVDAAQRAAAQKALGAATLRALARRAGQRLGFIAPDPEPLTQAETERRFRAAAGVYRQQVAAALQTFADDNDIDRLFNDIRTELAVLHYQSEVIANGGARFVGRDAKARMDTALAEQEKYLTRWEQEVRATDPDALSIPRMEVRAAMYAEAAQNEMERAYNAALGLPDLPFYPKDGRTECIVNCKCRWEYQKLSGDGNWDIFWRVDRAAENCPTCLRRESLARPLQVRDGRIVLPPNLNDAYV